MPPTQVKGPKHLGHLPLLAHAQQQGAELKGEMPELELVLIWDAGIIA